MLSWMPLVLALTFGGPAGAQESERITLLSTSDLHAHLYPYDYFGGKEAELGLAKVATLVRQARMEDPDALLLDAGDTIQGTPLAYYHYRIEPTEQNPIILAMNRLGYDAMTVGNHEFNFGSDILEKAHRQSAFPWLAANLVRASDGQPVYQPWVIFERHGIRIGVLGLITKNVPAWERPDHIRGLRFDDSVETARRYVPLLRERERCDVVVVLTHQGFERDLDTEESNGTEVENQAYALAMGVPGIDVLLAGHAHRNIEPRMLGGVLVSMPDYFGKRLTRIELRLRRGAGGRWAIESRSGANLSVAGVAADPEILEVARPFHDRTLDYIHRPIGTLPSPMPGGRARLEDTELMELLQDVQLHYTGADLSMASMQPARPPSFPAGPITIQNIYSFYIYDNSLYVLEVTGRQIKEALEVSARYYAGAAMDSSGRLRVGIDPKIMPFNFDMLEGATYQIDPTRPVGQRILNLSLDPDRKYRLAVNSYRAAGSAGYDMFKDAPRVYVSSDEIRELLIQYIREKPQIEPHCDKNWFVAPVPVFAEEAPTR